MLNKMSINVEKVVLKNMATEEIKNNNSIKKNFRPYLIKILKIENLKKMRL